MLTLDEYHPAIRLDEAFATDAVTERDAYEQLVAELLEHFHGEAGRKEAIPRAPAEQRRWLKALLTVRPPHPLEDAIWQRLDQLFHLEKLERSHVRADDIPPLAAEIEVCRYPNADRTMLWQGDISLLDVDVITNAANNAMLGCFQPFHACIDNVIHSYAGPRLRDDCERIMKLQGHPEATGAAKLTRAYHLPSRYVAHTVGPIVGGDRPTDNQRNELAGCYRNILDVCEQWGDIRSVAFCCVSTGVFGYPQEDAARVALRTVDQWRQDHPNSRIETVIFNVFRDDDRDIYMRLLAKY
jgi:O-acetyl-ADP-ribose deacetylase (regulator of RNase III)